MPRAVNQEPTALIDPRDPKAITKELVKIPSDRGTEDVVTYIEQFAGEHLPSNLRVKRIPTGRKGHVNLTIATSDTPKLIIPVHGDHTARSVDTDTYTNFGAEERDGYIWGRGTSDAKSGIAVALASLASLKDRPQDVPDMMLLITADEEHGLTGMKRIQREFNELAVKEPNYQPDYVLSFNGLDGKLSRGCRGCIECRVRIQGIGGHMAIRNESDPNWVEPVDAGEIGTNVLMSLVKELRVLPENDYGNVRASITGSRIGTQIPGNWYHETVNMVPNRFRAMLAVRQNGELFRGQPLNGDLIGWILRVNALAWGAKAVDTQLINDVVPWKSSPESSEWLERHIMAATGWSEVPISYARNRGLEEAAILFNAFNYNKRPDERRVEGATFGFADGSTFHKEQERVSVEGLRMWKEVTDQVFKEVRFRNTSHFAVTR